MAVRPTKARYELNQMWKRATGNTYKERKARKKGPRTVVRSPYSRGSDIAVRANIASRGLSRGSVWNRLRRLSKR